VQKVEYMPDEAFRTNVQKYLRTSGYSQKELADALGLHPKVLSRKFNSRGNAHVTQLEVQRIITTLARWRVITTQEEALHLLQAAALGPNTFGPDEWQASPLSTLARKQTPPISSSTSTHPPQHNLPAPVTRLIGREWAVERLRHLLGHEEVRLVTLVGSGGSGKTRLALHIASELAGSFAQGAWFVSLVGVSDPALVPMSILQALHMQPTPGESPLQSLISSLKERQLLLLLDNCEQVEAAGIVDQMLAGTPGLKVLITSRVALHLYGEHEFSVPPLDVPDPHLVQEVTELVHYGAVQLFVERAQAVMPDFALTPENTALIVQICARVDGLPLALELAAARVKILTPAQLLEKLTHTRLDVLTGGARNLPDRQRTLRKTITWSYNLLSEAEQAWFCHLGIFTDGCSLEAAEAIMQDGVGEQGSSALLPGEIAGSSLDMLERLVDNSLLIRVPAAHGQVRFKMLETLREYALEQLSAPEREELRDWHACYYVREAEAAELGLRGPQQLVWLARQAADRDNFRAALEWLLQRARERGRIKALVHPDAPKKSKAVAGSRTLSSQNVPETGWLAGELCLRLAAAIRCYWEWQGHLSEARHWLKAALEVVYEDQREATADTRKQSLQAARAKALSENARLVSLENDQARSIELAEESIALWQELDDPIGLATALMHRSWAAHALSDYETAKSVCQQGLQVLSSTDDLWLRGQLFMYLAMPVGFMSDFEHMRSCYAQSRELLEQVGDISGVADVLKDQGAMLMLESRYTDAIDSLLKSMRLCYQLDHKQYLTTGMTWLSLAFGLREEPDPATASLHSAQLEGAVEGLAGTVGLTHWSKTHPLIQMVRQQIRSRVDEQSWQAAWERGRALTIEQALDLAQRLRDPSAPEESQPIEQETGSQGHSF
jgi:predicted ATPase